MRSSVSWRRMKDLIIVLTPVAAGVLGAVQWSLNSQQDKLAAALDQRIGRTKLIDDMLANVEQYLDKSQLDERSKGRIIVSLLKVSTDVSLAKEGELDRRQESFVRKIPLYFALLAGNDDMLADIGAEESEMELWIEFAARTGDRDIKKTALRTLDQIISTSDDLEVRKNVGQALLQMRVAQDDPELRSAFRNSIVGALAGLNPAIDQAPDDADIKVLLSNLDVLRADLELPGSGAALPVGESDQNSTQIASADGVTPEVRQRAENVVANLLPPPTQPQLDTRVKELIAELEGQRRRAARNELARIGAPAVPALLAALATPNPPYRVRLGVISAFALMDPSVEIPAEGMNDIVRLLNDPDSLIRETTIKFLANLTDPASIAHAKDALFVNLDELTDGMRVYNSVRVLGEWLQRADLKASEPTSQIQAKLEDTQSRLVPAERWHDVISLIERYRSYDGPT
jgi:hypothetical protein